MQISKQKLLQLYFVIAEYLVNLFVIKGVLIMAKNVTVQKIISILLQRIKFIILTTILVGMLFFLYSNFIVTPMYSTSSMIYVQNYNVSDKGTNQEAQKIYGSDISGSSSLANICVTLFKNSDKITTLYDGCNVSIEVDGSSFFINISVTGDDPQKCANVANQIADISEDVFKDHFAYGQIGLIRAAKVPVAPYYPNNLKNTLIGFVVGLAAACVISILLELIDTTIKSDDDIQAIYGLPVFAEIPDFENQSR